MASFEESEYQLSNELDFPFSDFTESAIPTPKNTAEQEITYPLAIDPLLGDN